MKDVLQAVIRNAKKDFKDLELERAKVCAGCSEKKKAFYSDFFNSIMKEVEGFVCLRCDCPISNKVFAKDKKNICNKWKL